MGGVPLSPLGRRQAPPDAARRARRRGQRRGIARAAATALIVAAGWAPALLAAGEGDLAAAQAMIREGLRHLEAGNADRAVRSFERAVQIAPAEPSTYLHLARAHSAARRFAEAHKVLSKATIHAHGESKVLYEVELARGDLYRDEGRIEPARAAYKKAAGLKFFNREARERLKSLEAPAEPPGDAPRQE